MSGDVAAQNSDCNSQEDLDVETEHLLRTQRQYYDSVHVVKEKACTSLQVYLEFGSHQVRDMTGVGSFGVNVSNFFYWSISARWNSQKCFRTALCARTSLAE
jgi:hypothetical protein